MSAYRDKPDGWQAPDLLPRMDVHRLMKCKTVTLPGVRYPVATITQREWEELVRDPVAQRMMSLDVPPGFVALVAGSALIRITAGT